MMHNNVITLTFCDVSENHVMMQKIGKIASNGYSLQDLEKFKKKFKKGDIIELECDEEIEDTCDNPVEFEKAYLLVIRNGISILTDADQLYAEQLDLDFDKKVWMRGQVKNKIARWNLCFGENSQEPDYANKKGRIIAFNELKMLNDLKAKLQKITGDTDLTCELNYYYDLKKTGIGYHGDSERKRVIGCRLGATMNLCYQWYYKGMPVGSNIKFALNHGDIYIMSEKSVGYDWKRRNISTLRHAAGCSKYTTVKKPKDEIDIIVDLT